ncbi:MAG TPA: hypothetical protein VE404_04305 [Verrucomicrobiae bacterium]|nr:hypothetical protein [Verrucomicrobiae bacterium]
MKFIFMITTRSTPGDTRSRRGERNLKETGSRTSKDEAAADLMPGRFEAAVAMTVADEDAAAVGTTIATCA